MPKTVQIGIKIKTTKSQQSTQIRTELQYQI